MKGVCIDKGSSWHLQKGEEYFLEEYGPNNFSASRFDKPKSYFGIFRKSLFRLIEAEQAEWPAEPPQVDKREQLELKTRYAAQMVWRKPHLQHMPLGEYYVTINPRSAMVAVYQDPGFEKLTLLCPIWWFDSFRDIEADPPAAAEPIQEIIPEEPAEERWEQLDLFKI